MSNPTWSAQQEAIFEFFKSGKGNLTIRARAGTGKTTTIIEGIEHAPEDKILLAAFNKRIAEELKTKLKNPRAQAKTLHGVGFSWVLRNWAKNGQKLEIENDRCFRIALETMGWNGPAVDGFHKKVAGVIARMASMAKNVAPFATESELENLTYDYDILPDDYEELDERGYGIRVLARSASRVLAACAQPNQTKAPSVDFDDMVFVPLRNNWVRGTQGLVVIDEAQDMNASQLMLAQRSCRAGGRIVVVGDDRQCQPAGTTVTIVDDQASGSRAATLKDVPIETLKGGEEVLGYNVSDSSFSRNKVVLRTASRPYSGQLVEVRTEMGLQSRYTPDHICLASFKAIRNHYGVYLMRKGDFWRVGMTRLKHPVGVTGLNQRLHAEGADEVWLLDTRERRIDALLLEARVAAMFGLPTMMFTVKNNSKMTQADVDRFWASMPHLAVGAGRALKHFGRDRRFPVVSKGMPPYAFSVSRPREVRACNLMTGCLVLPFSGKTHVLRSEWVPVKVSRMDYEGEVYSLEVENGLYVADGLVTHNCIYGFRGADSESLDRLKTELKAQELGLTITYRCPKAVVEVAQVLVPDYQAAPTAPEGVIRDITEGQLVAEVQANDFVLSRKNSPLVGFCLAALRAGKRARIEGRDIGQGIINLVEKMNARDLVSLEKKLGDWETKQCQRFVARLGEEKAASKCAEICDTRATIVALCEGLKTVRELEARIQALFTNNGTEQVIFSSVHKAKGLETNRVFIIESSFDVSGPEESNIRYVAVTRAKAELVYVNTKEVA